MSDLLMIRQCLKEYKDKQMEGDILWVRNIIQHIGLEEFDKIFYEEMRDK